MSEPITLAGARILVTGASTGIGRATAERLAQAGAAVMATVRQEADGAPLRAAGCDVAVLDVTDQAAGAALVQRLAPLDVLINNAGASYRGAIEEGDDAAIRRIFEVNFFGPCALVRAALPGMRERRRGAIVNVSSISGRLSQPLNGYYPATKHALEAVTEALAYEVRPFNIRVALIEPGGVKSAFLPNLQAEPRTYNNPASPYAPLAQKLAIGTPRGSDPAIVAETIVQALTAPAPGQLRWPATPDAEEILAQRAALDDAAFMRYNVQRLGVDW
jgi:NAD(P)-dependent dehydrogenase (short-subunit alcohol dehydrogenase family)